MNSHYHKPVLLSEAINGLQIKEDGVYIDATFGGGGHSRAILESLSDRGRLIAFDYDIDAQKNVIERKNFIFIVSNFRFIPFYLNFLGIDKVDGIIADLGVSSYQIDTGERGFSFRYDYPLDMRMNRQIDLTAEKVINTYSVEKLQDIFSRYGQIHNARRLSQHIVLMRSKERIITTGQFIDVIKPMIPKKNEQKYLAKVFQAIRIEVNKEIDNLNAFLLNLPKILKSGGRVAIITYHSLEDRQVKNFLKTGNLEGVPQRDFYGNFISPFRMITKKPLLPSEEEIKNNRRSRSAKLRIAELI